MEGGDIMPEPGDEADWMVAHESKRTGEANPSAGAAKPVDRSLVSNLSPGPRRRSDEVAIDGPTRGGFINLNHHVRPILR